MPVIGQEAGHHPQPAPRFHQRRESSPLPLRPVQVLEYLGAGDEVVLLIEHRRVRGVNRIVDPHRVAAFLQHAGQGRARAAAEIQPPVAGAQALAQRRPQLIQETPVAGVVRFIAVQVVLGFFVGAVG